MQCEIEKVPTPIQKNKAYAGPPLTLRIRGAQHAPPPAMRWINSFFSDAMLCDVTCPKRRPASAETRDINMKRTCWKERKIERATFAFFCLKCVHEKLLRFVSRPDPYPVKQRTLGDARLRWWGPLAAWAVVCLPPGAKAVCFEFINLDTHRPPLRAHTHLNAVLGRREPHGAAAAAATDPPPLLLVSRAAALPPTAVGVDLAAVVAAPLCCNVKAKPRTSATRRAIPAAATNPRRR